MDVQTATIEGPTLKAFIGELTGRQTEVDLWMAEGKKDSEIAMIIGCTARTVKFHVAKSMEKLNCHTRPQMIAILFAKGVLSARTMAVLLTCSLMWGVILETNMVYNLGDIEKPMRIRGGSRTVARNHRPLQNHAGAGRC